MAGVRCLVARLVLLSGFVGMAQRVVAQQAGSSSHMPAPSLEARVDDLDQLAGPFRMQVRTHPRNGTGRAGEDRAGVFEVARAFFNKHLR